MNTAPTSMTTVQVRRPATIGMQAATGGSATTPAAALPGLRARLREAVFPDYNRAAFIYWCVVVVLGSGALALSVAGVAQLPAASLGQVLLIASIAAVVGLFPLQIPKTKNSIAAGDVFIFLTLLLYGPFAAALAAAAEAAVAAWRTSTRWTSRLLGPASAALTMLACGSGFALVQDALLRAGLAADIALLVALMLFTVAYFIASPLVITAVAYLKRRRWPGVREAIESFGWLGLGYAGSAAVAAVLFLSHQRFGVFSVAVAAPMIGMFLATLNHFFSQQEAAEREAAERAARVRADAAEHEAAQAAAHLQALEQSDRRFHSAFTHAAIGMALVSPDGQVLQCNQAMSMLLARGDAEIVGAPFRSFLNPFDATRIEHELHLIRAHASDGFQFELRVRRPDGREDWASLHCGYFSHGAVGDGCLIVQAFDVTARRQAEARLQHMAYHDGLTNLANRSRLHEAMALAIDTHRDDPTRQFGVLYLSFDGYRSLNDSQGLGAGDMFLVRVGRRLKELALPGDLVARVGGEEFAILTHCDQQGTHQVLALAEEVLRALSAPLAIEDTEVATGLTVGVTFCDVGYLNPEEALRDADLARQKAKASGKAEPAIFDPNLHECAKDKLLLEAALRRAIAANQLALAFQPIYDLHTCRVVGFEALARWEHPERGSVSPATFIRVAEESGLIGALTQWAISRACMRLRDWRERHPALPELFVNVNISGLDLCDPRFADFVGETLRQHGLPPAALTLEITENTLMQQLERGSSTLAKLHDLGVGLSVDDFGTGYSSLSYLSTLPISSLKIDRSFVSRLEVRAADAEIVRAVIQLGDALGKRVVAEGIETATQLERLQGYGCELGQGYHFSRPLTPQLALQLLDSEADGTAPAPTKPTHRANDNTEGTPTWPTSIPA
ncbi:MAG: EAL domain-containing protein [Burkholderiaceae bacterium]|nr:EAL domain-containing protein [Burkholderiaceae bacterium]